MNRSTPSSADQATETFVNQLIAVQRLLYVYLLSLTQSIGDTEDLLQEVNLVLWREQAAYDPGASFQAWALQVAKYQTLAWRKRASRRPMPLGDELLQQLSAEAEQRLEEVDDRLAALAQCVQKLRSTDRALLQRRYGEGRTLRELTEADDRGLSGVHYALQRIHEKLIACVKRTLAQESGR